jgi:hypothetical protein
MVILLEDGELGWEKCDMEKIERPQRRTIKWHLVWRVARMILSSYIVSLLIISGVIVFTPALGFFRTVRLVGITFAVAGALFSLVPRAMREPEEIQSQADTYWGSNPHVKKALLRDTRIAQWGMVLILVGFLNQLFGNLG